MLLISDSGAERPTPKPLKTVIAKTIKQYTNITNPYRSNKY
jgi:hypothetical protein